MQVLPWVLYAMWWNSRFNRGRFYFVGKCKHVWWLLGFTTALRVRPIGIIPSYWFRSLKTPPVPQVNNLGNLSINSLISGSWEKPGIIIAVKISIINAFLNVSSLQFLISLNLNVRQYTMIRNNSKNTHYLLYYSYNIFLPNS